MTQFRPCIDLHQGKVKQIIGGSLNADGAETNFISEHDSRYYAEIYRDANLTGGHVISLGKDNQEEAMKALATYPGGLQFGGGIHPQNAHEYLDAGASHVIVTSYIFDGPKLSLDKLAAIKKAVGKDKLVLDLSCRRVDKDWFIATNRWQTITDTAISESTLAVLSNYCDEFLIHAADVEGLQRGIDEALVEKLGDIAVLPMTYAGGARHIDDLHTVKQLSQGRVDLTIGSALDIFGGKGITLQSCIDFNKHS